jgi:2EXR family protein
MSRNVTDFSTLPTELRLRIWHFSCLDARVIEVRTNDWSGNWNISFLPNRNGTEIRTIQWETKCPPPVALCVCHESRKEALKVYTLRFEVLASGAYTIYLNPVLDTVYGNFKWQSEFMAILMHEMKAFDEEEIGIRNLALPLRYGWIGWNSSRTLSSLTLIIENSFEPYWEDWDEDTVLVVPTTDSEVRTWEQEGREASAAFESANRGRENVPVLKFAAIRRRDAARVLSEEDRKFPVLQGPMRPHIDYDSIPPGVAEWDRYDL